MLSFPPNPSVGDTYLGWAWNGQGWTCSGAGGGEFLPLAGGTMTGPVTLAGDATQPLEPVAFRQMTGTPIHSGPTPPSSPQLDDLWFDTDNGVLNQWNGSAWIAATAPVTGFLPLTGGVTTGPVWVGGSQLGTTGIINSLSGIVSSSYNTGRGGVLASGQYPGDIIVGLWTVNNVLYFGTIDGNLAPLTPRGYWDNAGNLNTVGNLLSNGAVYPNIGATPDFYLGNTGANVRFTSYGNSGGTRWEYDVSTGNASWYVGDNQFLFCSWSLQAIGNQRGFVFGYGPYQDLSDASLKHDVTQSRYGLAEILRLNPVTFKRLSLTAEGTDTEADAKTEIGFTAQDVAPVLPEAVREVPFGDSPKLTVASSAVTATLVNAVKELAQRVSEQTARIEALETQLRRQ